MSYSIVTGSTPSDSRGHTYRNGTLGIQQPVKGSDKLAKSVLNPTAGLLLSHNWSLLEAFDTITLHHTVRL